MMTCEQPNNQYWLVNVKYYVHEQTVVMIMCELMYVWWCSAMISNMSGDVSPGVSPTSGCTHRSVMTHTRGSHGSGSGEPPAPETLLWSVATDLVWLVMIFVSRWVIWSIFVLKQKNKKYNSKWG